MPTGFSVSVALGTRNGAAFVAEQIASILAQTRPVDEIVLSDDASVDGTVEIVLDAVAAYREDQGSAPELRVLRNDPPLGITKNFERALLAARGDLLALCDQDDVWHPRRVERLAANFRDPRVLLVFSNARQVDETGASLGHELFEAIGMSAGERRLLESGRAFEAFLRRNLATGATVMLRRALAVEAAPFPETWLHDEWLAVIAAAQDGARLHDEALTDYRQHGGNQVGMRRMTVGRKLTMFAQPRTERNRRLFLRARELPVALDRMPGIPAAYRAAAAEKLAFETARQAYPEARLRRAVPILRQLRSGRYARYGTGMKDAARNLVQPV